MTMCIMSLLPLAISTKKIDRQLPAARTGRAVRGFTKRESCEASGVLLMRWQNNAQGLGCLNSTFDPFLAPGFPGCP
jgi:hypothetical protein